MGSLKEKNCEYIGQWEKGMKSGKGKLLIHNKIVYDGEFLNNQFNGKGIFFDESENTYKGFWKNGKLCGEGEFISRTEGKYEGEFQDNYFHGKGTKIDKLGNRFEGYWLMGKKNGLFKFFHTSEIIIEATYENDLIVGQKTVIFPNPNPIIYKGDIGKNTENEIIDLFVNGDSQQYKIKENPLINGNNEIFFANGDKLQGQFLNGLFKAGNARINILIQNNKSGKMIRQYIEVENNKIFAFSCRYEGYISNGQLNGEGSLTYLDFGKVLDEFKDHPKIIDIKEAFDIHSNFKASWERNQMSKSDKFLILMKDKTIYLGGIVNNKFQGEGRSFYPNGDYFEGIFKNDKFDKGKGLISLGDNKYYEGEFENGTSCGKGKISTPETLYEGEVLNYLMQGKGKRTYIDIEKFKHFYIQNPKSNELKKFFNENNSFIGRFDNDIIVEGEGTLIFVKEGIYNGRIENGTRTGLGSMYYENGDSYSGNWKNNLYQGKGEYIASTSNVFSGMWIESKPERDIKVPATSQLRIVPLKNSKYN